MSCWYFDRAWEVASSHLPPLGEEEPSMSSNRPFGLIGTLVLFVGVFLAFSGCWDDRGTVTSPSGPHVAGMKASRQAHLWLSFANVESTYFDADPNAWLTDSWVTESGSFDLDVLNNAKFATQNVVLLVTVPNKIIAIPGWSITINGIPSSLGPASSKPIRRCTASTEGS